MGDVAKTATEVDLEQVDVTDCEHWIRARRIPCSQGSAASAPCTGARSTSTPNEEGFWSVARADDVREVSLDWETFSSERGGVTGLTHAVPLELQQAMFIGMDPPKHDRLKMPVPARLHPEADRRARGRDPRDRRARARRRR